MSISKPAGIAAAHDLPAEIFKAYDIRGIVGKTLTPEIVERIGQALGSEALAIKQKRFVIGRDGRLSGPELSAALARGIARAGCDVVDIGMVPTPVVYLPSSIWTPARVWPLPAATILPITTASRWSSAASPSRVN